MRTLQGFRIASPWISLEDKTYHTADGRTIHKAGAEKAEVILVLAVHDEEIEELIDTMIRCPHCGWQAMNVERIQAYDGIHYYREELRGEPISLPARFQGQTVRVKARCERCRRLNAVESCGYGLRDLPVVIYKIGDRSTVDYPSLSEAQKAIREEKEAGIPSAAPPEEQKEK
jgi:DNA-directed RNA polymerase subunit RPC12/RpoP